MVRRGPWIAAAALVAAGFLARGACLLATRDAYAGALMPDERRYLEAGGFRAKQGHGRSWEPSPGYPAFLAVLKGLGLSRDMAAAAQMLLGSLACLALVPLGRHAAMSAGADLRFGRLLGWGSAWGAALSPGLGAYAGLFLTEALYLPLQMGVLALGAGALARLSPLRGLGAGLLLAAAHLVRPIALPQALLLAAWLALCGARRAGASVLLGTLGLLLAVGVLREAPVREAFFPARYFAHMQEASRLATARAGLPASGTGLAWRRAAWVWRPVPRTAPLDHGWRAALSVLWWTLTVPAAMAGAWLLRRSWRVAGLLLLVPLYTTVLHAFTSASMRYRAPAEPALLCLAGFACLRLKTRTGPA